MSDRAAGGSEASVRHVLGRLAAQLELLDALEATAGPRGQPVLTHVPDRLPPPIDRGAARRFASVEADADRAETDGQLLRLRRLARLLRLSEVDVEVLLLAAAPDIDPRHAQRYLALQGGDRVHLTPGLALRLTGLHLANGAARARYGPAGPLARAGLVRIRPEDRAYAQSSLQVPERVLVHLLGADVPGVELAQLLRSSPPLDGPVADELERAVRAGTQLVHLRDRAAGQGSSPAVAALARFGAAPVQLDLARLPVSEPGAVRLLDEAVLEARLRGVGLIAGPLDELAERSPALISRLAGTETVTVLHGRRAWDPAWSSRVPLLLATGRVTDDQRAALWRRALGTELAGAVDAPGVTRQYRLSPEQLVSAAGSARHRAQARGGQLLADDLRAGAQAQNDVALSRLARRITPRARWDELVLPPAVDAAVRDLATRWRHRDRVLGTWGLRRGTGQGQGVTALFSGDPGTGKTLSAEVLASELGLDLYIVELSTVIDKYIGETSKNLERIFDAADRVNGILLFDEADALFGKRSSVSDAKDRHANVEVAYLLQRMEAFDGIAILTTNLAANLDEAFLRRLDAIVDFPAPDVPQRRALWEALLPAALPRADDLDLDLLAERFRLSGSEIRNIITSAAYRAAELDAPVDMRSLVRAVVREHRKVGRHLSPHDLGEHAALLTEGA